MWKNQLIEDLFKAKVARRLLLITLAILGTGLLRPVMISSSGPAEGYVYFGLIPGSAESITPLFPRGTRLARWSESKDLEWVAQGLELTSPPTISFDGQTVLFSAVQSGQGLSQIWEHKVSGSAVRRVMDLPYDCFTPAYLPDDRTAFVARVDGASGRQSFIAAFADGGEQPQRISFSTGLQVIKRILPDGRILYREFDQDYSNDRLLVIRPDGSEIEEYFNEEHSGAPGDSGERPLPDFFGGRFPGGIIELEPTSGMSDPYRIVGAVLANPRPRPPVSTTVVDPSASAGWFLCLNVYQSDQNLEAGSVQCAEFLEGGNRVLLGKVPVEEDGSFFVKVPANRPLRIRLLDDQGNEVGRPSGEIWVRPNESRGCVGCHEKRYMTPENRLPVALEAEAVDLSSRRESESRARR